PRCPPCHSAEPGHSRVILSAHKAAVAGGRARAALVRADAMQQFLLTEHGRRFDKSRAVEKLAERHRLQGLTPKELEARRARSIKGLQALAERRRRDGPTAKEVANGRRLALRGAIWWKRLTPAQRSAEVQKRLTTRRRNAALRK